MESESVRYELSIQVQGNVSEEALEKISTLATELGLNFAAEEHDEEENYINLYVFGDEFEDIQQFWLEMTIELEQGCEILAPLAKNWIVILVEDGDWDSYLLIAHYMESEKALIASNFLDEEFDWAEHLENLPDDSFEE